MVDSQLDDSGNENDVESPAEPRSTSDAPSSVRHLSAEPPRWRFVADAKKASGYSTLAAGRHVQGKSGEELGAKYVAPDASPHNAEGEKPEVGRLRIRQPPSGDGCSEQDVEVGKLKSNALDDDDESETSANQNIEMGDSERKAQEGGELAEMQTNVSEESLEEGDDDRSNLNDDSPNRAQPTGEAPSWGTSTINQNEGDELDGRLNNGEAMKDETNLDHLEASKEEDVDDSAKETHPKRRHRFLYFVIFLLLILVIVLGVLLGKKNDTGVASSTSQNAADNADALDGTSTVTSTSKPSFYSSVISTNNMSGRPLASPNKQLTILPSKQPTINPSIQLTNLPSKQPTLNPSMKPSTSPSEKPTSDPSKAPTDKPTNAPFRKPSFRPTPPPTNVPTSNPTCLADQQSFSLCLAINMSGSLCNGRTGALCVGCPQVIQSSDPRESFCRDAGVNWNSCCSNFANVKQLATLIVNALGDSPVDKSFSVVQFASDARIVSGLSSASQALSTIGQLTYSGGLDNHGSAIQMCQQTLSRSPNENRIIMIVTDGETGVPDYVPEGATESAAASAKNEGTFIFTVLVPPDPPDTNEGAIPMFSQISSSGEVFDFTDYSMSDVMILREELMDHVSCS